MAFENVRFFFLILFSIVLYCIVLYCVGDDCKVCHVAFSFSALLSNFRQDLITVIETYHTATHFVFCSCQVAVVVVRRLNLVSGGFATLTPNLICTAKFPACLESQVHVNFI